METELVLIDEVDAKIKEGWKLHGPPEFDGEWKQTIIQRYPDAYTTALMISTKKPKSLLDIEWIFKRIADLFVRSLDYIMNGKGEEGEGDVSLEPLVSNGGWPSFIPRFGLDKLGIFSVGFVYIFVVNPIMYSISAGVALGKGAIVRLTFAVQFILLAFRVYLKLTYLRLMELEGMEIGKVKFLNDIEFTGPKFKFAQMILNRVENMAKINGLVFDGDIPAEVRDKVRNMFETILGNRQTELTHALWILLQY